MHIHNFFLTLQHLKSLQHVSILRSSSGSYTSLLKSHLKKKCDFSKEPINYIADHLQGATLFLAKVTFKKKCDFSKEQCSSLNMILGSKHVGAILNVLI